MTGHLVSSPVFGFHIGLGTVVEQAHFWSKAPLMNGVSRWQLNIKPDFTHLFHGTTLGVCPSVHFLHREDTDVKPANFWSQGLLVNGVRSWQLSIKHDLTHQFHGLTLGCLPQCPGSTSVRAPMWNRPTSGARVHL